MGILDSDFAGFGGGDSQGILGFYKRLLDEIQPDARGLAPSIPGNAMGAAPAMPRIPYTQPGDQQDTNAQPPVAAPQAPPSGPDFGNFLGGLGNRLNAGVMGALSGGPPAAAFGNLLQGLL